LAITYTSNATWTLAGSPFIIDGNVQVAAGATLTIEPGVVVKFNGAMRWLRVTGTLKAIGTGVDPVTFTSIQDDSIAGDSGGDGATSGARGQWSDLEIVSGMQSEFRNVDVRYGGFGSADWGYGAISVSGSGTSVIIAESDIHDNQRSGVKIFEGGATLSHSTISNNAMGIAVNMGWVAIANRTAISTNTSDGVWFNYTNTYSGTTSSLFDSDVIGNGRYGINLGVDRTLPTTYWPHGNRNNIYDNVSKQLFLGGYHPATTSQYDVDWTNNYWGSDVYYWNAPSACSTTPPNVPGHLAHQSSTANPPAGPVSSSTYLAGTSYCSYDRFLISPSAFNTAYSQPEPTLTPQQHATVVEIAEDDPRVQDLLAGHSYAVADVDPWSRIHADLLLGAEITFSWTDPASIDSTWPGISYDYSETSNPPYAESTTAYGVSNMKSLVVLVDLTRGIVVSIEPGLESVRTQPPPFMQVRSSGTVRTLADAGIAYDLGGYPTNRLQIVCLGGTCFWNYDFSRKAVDRGIRSDRVDWPVSMIFTNAAEVNRIKDAMCTWGIDYCDVGDPMWMNIRDGSAAPAVWDSDKGVKDIWCPGPGVTGPHMRLYADGDDRLGYNPTWGYFVLATTHFDHNECWLWGGWSGMTEDAEEKISTDIMNVHEVHGWTISRDLLNLFNAESGRRGSHRKQNDGLATIIRIPDA